MKFTDKELRILRLALSDWEQAESEGGTTPQEELDCANKLWQKLSRENVRQREKAGA
jgi:hypothetical protein